LFSVTTCGEALGVARRCAGLTDLVHVGEKRKHGLAVAALVDKRFAGTERSARFAQEVENEISGFARAHLSVRLLFSPSRSGDKEQLRIRPYGLRILRRDAEASYC